MKNSIPILVAAMAVGLFISCDNAAMLDKMKAEQQATVDSLATVQLNELRGELIASCDEEFSMAVKKAVDERVAAINGKTTPTVSKPSKPVVTPPPSKPVVPVTPAQPDDKSRGNASTGTNDQKSRGNASTSGTTKSDGSTVITKEKVEQQKSRGNAKKD